VGVSVSPVIPFLNEPELERILAAAAEAGASSAFSIVMRLPWEVNPLFQQWLQQHLPDRAARVMARIREMRGGRTTQPLRRAHDRQRHLGPTAAPALPQGG
jgi:DNA repair photolyase